MKLLGVFPGAAGAADVHRLSSVDDFVLMFVSSQVH